MAQLMRYHQYPVVGIGVSEHMIEVDGSWQVAYTRGGGAGEPYEWSQMPLAPDCSTSASGLQAIGALCYDAGIAAVTSYSFKDSSASFASAKVAVKTTFTYGNAVFGYDSGGGDWEGMINPNLDYGNPVIVGITRPGGGHAVLCDGYGYSLSTPYHHINMGWDGVDDAWYNLPDINSTPAYTSINGFIYNIHVSLEGDGELISGRVLDASGEPIPGAVVYVELDGALVSEVETNGKGIYAFNCLDSNTTYTIGAAAEGYAFSRRSVTTGESRDYSSKTGNVWGVDLHACAFRGDLTADGSVDARDMSKLAQYWLQDAECLDVSPQPYGDGVVDFQDFAFMAAYWLGGGK